MVHNVVFIPEYLVSVIQDDITIIWRILFMKHTVDLNRCTYTASGRRSNYVFYIFRKDVANIIWSWGMSRRGLFNCGFCRVYIGVSHFALKIKNVPHPLPYFVIIGPLFIQIVLFFLGRREQFGHRPQNLATPCSKFKKLNYSNIVVWYVKKRLW